VQCSTPNYHQMLVCCGKDHFFSVLEQRPHFFIVPHLILSLSTKQSIFYIKCGRLATYVGRHLTLGSGGASGGASGAQALPRTYGSAMKPSLSPLHF
jgi:hypothetical protein